MVECYKIVGKVLIMPITKNLNPIPKWLMVNENEILFLFLICLRNPKIILVGLESPNTNLRWFINHQS